MKYLHHIIKRIELIRLMDLAWRPRGALNMVHVTKKNTRMMANIGCFAIIKNAVIKKNIYIFSYSKIVHFFLFLTITLKMKFLI